MMRRMLERPIRWRRWAACAAIGLLAAEVSAADPSAAPSAPTAPTKDATSNAYTHKLICTRYRPTGSHIDRQRCRTQAQMDAERDGAKQAVREAQADSVTAGGSAVPVPH